MTANTPTLVTFAIYLLGMLFIGWAGYKATTNLSDYILGGRSLGPVVTALSAGASDMSGWLLMGLPGAVFTQGLSASWIAIGLCIGAWFIWRFVAEDPPPGWGTIAVLLLFFGSVQLISLRLVGEYVGRVLLHINSRPQFIVRGESRRDDRP